MTGFRDLVGTGWTGLRGSVRDIVCVCGYLGCMVDLEGRGLGYVISFGVIRWDVRGCDTVLPLGEPRGLVVDSSDVVFLNTLQDGRKWFHHTTRAAEKLSRKNLFSENSRRSLL